VGKIQLNGSKTFFVEDAMMLLLGEVNFLFIFTRVIYTSKLLNICTSNVFVLSALKKTLFYVL